MLSVGLGEQDALSLLEQIGTESLSLACVNSPSSTTLSGDAAAIVELQNKLNDMGIFHRRLKVDTAYHSHHMYRVADDYLHLLGKIEWKSLGNGIVYISSVTGRRKDSGFGAEYWVENLISRVQFANALSAYHGQELASSHTERVRHLYIEIGPHGALEAPIRQNLAKASSPQDQIYFPTLIRGRDAVHCILSLAGRLFDHGCRVNLRNVNSLPGSNNNVHVISSLPTYPWDHSITYWHESRLSRDYRLRGDACHELLGVRNPSSSDLEPSWRYILALDRLPWLADHIVDGLMTYPAAGYLCIAIEAASQLGRKLGINTQSFVLRNIEFFKALVIPSASKQIEMQLCFRSQWLGGVLWNEFRIYALPQDGSWQEHSRGRILASDIGLQRPSQSMPGNGRFEGVVVHNLGKEELYKDLKLSGNTYGPCFAGIQCVQVGESMARGHIVIQDTESTMPARFQQPHIIHPTTLYAILHSTLPLFRRKCGSGSVMPVAIEEMRVTSKLICKAGDDLSATLQLYPYSKTSALADLSVSAGTEYDDQQPLLFVSNVKLLGVGGTSQHGQEVSQRNDVAHRLIWVPQTKSEHHDDVDDSSIMSGVYTEQVSGLPTRCSSDPVPLPLRHSKILHNNTVPGKRETILLTWQSSRAFAVELASVLENDNHNVKIMGWPPQHLDNQALVLVLDDSKQPLLENPSAELFQHIIRLIESVPTIFWVSVRIAADEESSLVDPKNALVTGFARSARAEHAQLRFGLFDI